MNNPFVEVDVKNPLLPSPKEGLGNSPVESTGFVSGFVSGFTSGLSFVYFFCSVFLSSTFVAFSSSFDFYFSDIFGRRSPKRVADVFDLVPSVFFGVG